MSDRDTALTISELEIAFLRETLLDVQAELDACDATPATSEKVELALAILGVTSEAEEDEQDEDERE